MHVKISAVIPAYNSASTIAESLDSVARQRVPPTEIIVVDDASSDQTVAVVKAWQEQHAMPLILIRQPHNAGPATARNAGIDRASGAWIAFLDADDAWLPWHLALQAACIQQHPDVQLVCAQTIDLATTAPDGEDIQLPAAPAHTRIDLDTFVSHNPVATSTVLVRTTTLRATGGFDPRFCGPEDYDLWLRIAAQGTILLQHAPTSRYRTTAGSLSMDDRRFLPQVLHVLAKAFAPGGALANHHRLKRRAFAEQFTAASWMAYNRHDRWRALRLLLRSWLCGPTRLAKERSDPLQRLKLLSRYLK